MNFNLRRILHHLRSFMISQRATGTTSLLREIAAKNDVWVLVPTAHEAKEFEHGRGLSFIDLEKKHALARKPILVDNHTLLKLCEDWDTTIGQLQQTVRDRDEVINEIEYLIRKFRTGKEQSPGNSEEMQNLLFREQPFRKCT